MSGVTLSEDGIVTGNTYDKYGASNPVDLSEPRAPESEPA